MSYFEAKMHQIRFRLGLRPTSRWGNLQRSPDHQLDLTRPTSKGKEGRETERKSTERDIRRGWRREECGSPTLYIFLLKGALCFSDGARVSGALPTPLFTSIYKQRPGLRSRRRKRIVTESKKSQPPMIRCILRT